MVSNNTNHNNHHHHHHQHCHRFLTLSVISQHPDLAVPLGTPWCLTPPTTTTTTNHHHHHQHCHRSLTLFVTSKHPDLAVPLGKPWCPTPPTTTTTTSTAIVPSPCLSPVSTQILMSAKARLAMVSGTPSCSLSSMADAPTSSRSVSISS